jgi:hypothetical protein
MPTFLEALYPAIAGVIIGAIGVGSKKLFAKINARKYAPMLAKVYDVVDPLLDKYYSGWDGSTIDTVLELAFDSVGDGTLTNEEVQAAVQLAKEKFLPDVAKTKKLDANTPEGRKSLEIAELVLKMEEGVSKEKVIEVAKASAPLVLPNKLLGLF